MTEEEAQSWLDQRGWWSGKAGDLLRQFVAMLLDEADRQNLISASSRDHVWARHIVDSAQLLALPGLFERASEGLWVDLGTGAGLPGMVIACLTNTPVRLVEVRPLRVAFLRRCAEALELCHVDVVGSKVERANLGEAAGIISARAYAPLDRLLTSAHHLSDENTIWLLPKGRQGEKELEIIRRDWQAVFHVEQSITDPESVIVTIQKLHRAQTNRLPALRGKSSRSFRGRSHS